MSSRGQHNFLLFASASALLRTAIKILQQCTCCISWLDITARCVSRSHLQGMFFRTARMLEAGIKPVYVFDGAPPAAKKEELARR